MPKLINRGSAGLHSRVNKKTTDGKLINRGVTGLLHKLSEEERKQADSIDLRGLLGEELWSRAPKNRIAPDLQKLPIMEMKDLVSDPDNARLHPERNLASIKDSLALYGQQKIIVVKEREDGKFVIMAGNGTYAAAKELGWERLAVSRTELEGASVAGFGLADNRTAELAKWDFKVIAKIERMMREVNEVPTGWSTDELMVLRTTNWEEPEAVVMPELPTGEKDPYIQVTFTLHTSQAETVRAAIKRASGMMAADNEINANRNGNALAYIVEKFLGVVAE